MISRIACFALIIIAVLLTACGGTAAEADERAVQPMAVVTPTQSLTSFGEAFDGLTMVFMQYPLSWTSRDEGVRGFTLVPPGEDEDAVSVNFNGMGTHPVCDWQTMKAKGQPFTDFIDCVGDGMLIDGRYTSVTIPYTLEGLNNIVLLNADRNDGKKVLFAYFPDGTPDTGTNGVAYVEYVYVPPKGDQYWMYVLEMIASMRAAG